LIGLPVALLAVYVWVKVGISDETAPQAGANSWREAAVLPSPTAPPLSTRSPRSECPLRP